MEDPAPSPVQCYALRRKLEEQAVRRTLLVDAIWRLYPKMLDRDLINRARVEARLRRASGYTARGQL